MSDRLGSVRAPTADEPSRRLLAGGPKGLEAREKKEATVDRDKMLDVTLQQIEKQFGKGAVMKLGRASGGSRGIGDPHGVARARPGARHRGRAPRSHHGSLRARGLGQDNGVSAHHRRGAGQRRHRRVHRRRARARPHLCARARGEHRRAARLPARLRRAGARDRRHARALGGARPRRHRLGRGAGSTR